MEIETIIKQLVAPYYTRQNLALVLATNRRTLDYKLAQLVAKGVLITIKPGFYLNKSLLSKSPQNEEFIEYVGSVLKFPSYISLSYALAKYGMIPESVYTVTYITTKKTAEFSANNINFSYRNIKPMLFSDYETRFYNQRPYLFAKNYKAIFDLIYLTAFATSVELKEFLFKSRFNWDALTTQDKNQFSDLCIRSNSRKMEMVDKLLKKKGVPCC